jgi:UDP-hydrolysing UDP-N-acetyl-D-glucosamine 2-epimerase
MSAEPRRIAVLTTGRQDFGILRSALHLMARDHRFDLRLWVGGMHLDPRFGRTVDMIRSDGLEPARELAFLRDRASAAEECANALALVHGALEEDRPEALLLLGDRSETLAAAVAALLARVPVIHLHGGEESEGAIDNAGRHAITKLSHLHLVSHLRHADRVVQMGEDPRSVIVVGAAGLDNLYREDLPDAVELSKSLAHPLVDPIVIVTMHPATLESRSMDDVRSVAKAMESVEATYVVTAPNADVGGDEIRDFWTAWCHDRANAMFSLTLGERAYWGLMRQARVVLGNSSSGIIEAPAAGATVINVGDRQRGRLRYGQVVDVAADADAIRRALSVAVAAPRPGSAAGGDAYPGGPASPRIVEAIAQWTPPTPPRKRFVNMRCSPATS